MKYTLEEDHCVLEIKSTFVQPYNESTSSITSDLNRLNESPLVSKRARISFRCMLYFVIGFYVSQVEPDQ